MFKLLRYFSIASAVALMVTAMLLLLLYRQDQLDEHTLLTEEENARLATSFANTFWPQFAPFLKVASGLPPEKLVKRGEIRAIDIALRSLLTGLPVLKVKIYDLTGLTIYSTVRDEVGNEKGDNPEFLAAATQGHPVSELSFRETFRSFDGVVTDRHVIETYVPVRLPDGSMVGVLELYTDVTPTIIRLEANTLKLGGLIFAIFAVLYGVLFLIVRRADGIIRSQRQDLERNRSDLRNQEQQFRAIADYTYDWESWFDAEGRPRWVNPAVERVVGYRVDECLAMPDYPLPMVHTGDRDAIARHLTKASEGNFEDNVEFRLVCKNGAVKWMAANYQPIFTENETLMGSRWSIRDVTDRKRAEQRLRDSELKFRSVTQSAADAIVSINDSGLIISWNEGAEDIFGYVEADVLGKNVTLLMPERYRERHLAGLARIVEGDSSEMVGIAVEFEGLRNDGTEFPLELMLSRWDMEDRIFFTAILRDITERKLAEEELRRSEATVRAVVDTSLDCIIAMDEKGHVVEFNPAAEATFGYKRADVVGQELAALIIPEAFRDKHREGLKRLLETGEGPVLSQRLELEALRADGTLFPVELAITAVQIDGPPRFTGFLRDITDRKEAEAALAERSEDLERSNAELQQFAYVASHDLQEPLRMVTSYMGLLQRRYKDDLDAQAEEFIGFAVDGAKRMQQLIKDLLEYSRVGTRGKAFQPTDLQQVVEEALLNLQARIEEVGAEVTYDALPQMDVDDGQLIRLFQNLVGNALKYCKPDVAPKVHIGAERQGRAWVFTITDNGIGIDPEHFERIFMVFQRLHGRGEYEGTGIGLAVCKKIVERHGGRMWVDSVPGEGSTFFFKLPEHHQAAAAQ